jgi:hypothetical protein
MDEKLKNVTERIAKEINDIEISSSCTLGSLFKQFYEIMKEYGIKESTKDGTTYEWILYKSLFVNNLQNEISYNMIVTLDEGFQIPDCLKGK